MFAGFDFFLDVKNLAIFADDKRPTLRESSSRTDDAVFLRGVFFRIAKNWVVELQFFGVARVGFNGITASSEYLHVVFVEPRAAVGFDREVSSTEF